MRESGFEEQPRASRNVLWSPLCVGELVRGDCTEVSVVSSLISI